MKKTILSLAFAAIALSTAAPAMAADTYKIDPTHSYVGFKASHLGFSNLLGRFEDVEGEFSYDAAAPEKSSVSVDVNVGSVNTNMSERDNHIRGEKLLSTDANPTATFRSTSIEVTGEHTAKISGDLTVLGKTLPIVVDAAHVGGGDDPWGGVRQGFSGRAKLSMKELGVQMDLGPASDAVELVVELEGVKQ
ncbi:YceI family protein [Pararhizobium sp. BT-229]|uniref:YceI family protein n=1 Tax=Pararhizobium sp. BT-229 TaxID=2986923 RepID=UPI0021F7DBAD|nr:YceI family protein [Pararhizobium sp. BT-229]MCV9964025.1 YceI family protein [Pararhizobium sp. BT-229]